MISGYGKFIYFKSNKNDDNIFATFDRKIDLISGNNEYVIFNNLIYLVGKDKTFVENHVKNLLDKSKPEYNELLSNFLEIKNIFKTTQKITSDTELQFRNTLKRIYIQLYEKSGDGYITLDRLPSKLNYFNLGGVTKNEFYEMANALLFDYEVNYRNKNLTYHDFLIGMYLPKYGSKKGIDSKIEYAQDLNDWDVSKFIHLLIPPEEKWERSTVLSAEQMIRSKIFSVGRYNFYSERSNVYSKIFTRLANSIRTSNLFDQYFRGLQSDKYFISDILAIKRGSLAEETLSKLVDKFAKKKTLENLKEVFTAMDTFFYDKEFIPISFKMIEDYSSNVENLPKDIIKEKDVKSSLVKVINPPKKNLDVPYRYKNITLDDFDVMLLILFNKMKIKGTDFDKELEKTIVVDNSTFKYSDFVDSVSYGGTPYNARVGPYSTFKSLYFEFDLFLTKTKKKRYTFEMVKSIKIRTKGSASSTGEGGINSYVLNYVMKEIYSNFNTKLTKISKNRSKNMKTIRDAQYKNIMSSNKLITPSTATDSDMQSLFNILLNEVNGKTNNGCLEHFKSYCESLKITPKFFSKESITTTLGNICGRELGLLFDKDIKVEKGIVKVPISEAEKNKVISSVWGLISARGPIEFNGQIFKTDDIENIYKYDIKFPALVKIGI